MRTVCSPNRTSDNPSIFMAEAKLSFLVGSAGAGINGGGVPPIASMIPLKPLSLSLTLQQSGGCVAAKVRKHRRFPVSFYRCFSSCEFRCLLSRQVSGLDEADPIAIRYMLQG